MHFSFWNDTSRLVLHKMSEITFSFINVGAELESLGNAAHIHQGMGND